MLHMKNVGTKWRCGRFSHLLVKQFFLSALQSVIILFLTLLFCCLVCCGSLCHLLRGRARTHTHTHTHQKSTGTVKAVIENQCNQFVKPEPSEHRRSVTEDKDGDHEWTHLALRVTQHHNHIFTWAPGGLVLPHQVCGRFRAHTGVRRPNLHIVNTVTWV